MRYNYVFISFLFCLMCVVCRIPYIFETLLQFRNVRTISQRLLYLTAINQYYMYVVWGMATVHHGFIPRTRITAVISHY